MRATRLSAIDITGLKQNAIGKISSTIPQNVVGNCIKKKMTDTNRMAD